MNSNVDSSLYLISYTNSWEQHEWLCYGGLVPSIESSGQPEENSSKCSICQKILCNKRSLRRHMRTHTGGKPFECEICRKQFTQSSGLRQHFRIHSGVKAFKCEMCGRCFTQSNGLRQHLNTRTTNKTK